MIMERFKKWAFIAIVTTVIAVMLLKIETPVYSSSEIMETEPVNILLLNSYHDGYIWSNELKDGVKHVLDENFEDYNLRIEHMDTKNIVTDTYINELYDMYRLKYNPEEFDVIVSADDNALKFLLKYRDALFNDTPVFFCGVNTLDAHVLDNTYNFYGVVEKSSIADTVDVALKQNPNIENIYLVVDDTITGRSTKADVRRDMKAYNDALNLFIFEDMTIHEIQNDIREIDPSNSIVIQTFYVVDIDERVYPLEYTSRLVVEASPVPVYSLYSFGFGNGTVGGKFVEGYSQGTRATEMASEYLKTGQYDGEKFIVDDSYNLYHFDYEVMEKYSLEMSVLPITSDIINKPITVYERHKTVINISLIVVFSLAIYVVALRIQLATQTMKITKTQKNLMESERMASLGRLVAGVAHEINTPVGIGVTLASHIENKTRAVQELSNENNITRLEFEEYIDDLRTSSEHLSENMKRASELIRSFKRVAVDQSTDDNREINLGEYLQEIIKSLKSELKHKAVDVKVKCDDKLVIWSHAGAIYQILMNLIINSMTHGFEGREHGLIEISAHRHANTKGSKVEHISIKYRDYGKGMNQNELENIYEPFFTTKRYQGGSGLGMHIVYNLVTQTLNGTIECTSAENAGTEFLIEFPLEVKDKNE